MDCVNAKSLPLRAIRAMRIARRFSARPQPFSNCCVMESEPTVCTDGLKNCAVEVVDARTVFSPAAIAVPVGNACTYDTFVFVLCVNCEDSVVEVVPVPAVSGLFTGECRL